MSIEKVKELLEQLQQELKNTPEQLDATTQKGILKLDDNIHAMLKIKNLQHQDVYDGIMHVEYDFLTKHPVASGLIREMVDILSKAGI